MDLENDKHHPRPKFSFPVFILLSSLLLFFLILVIANTLNQSRLILKNKAAEIKKSVAPWEETKFTAKKKSTDHQHPS